MTTYYWYKINDNKFISTSRKDLEEHMKIMKRKFPDGNFSTIKTKNTKVFSIVWGNVI